MTVQVKRVAIIGGGPSGGVSLDALIRENSFDQIVLFERKDGFGGSWRADKASDGRDVIPGRNDKASDPALEIPKGLRAGYPLIQKSSSNQTRWIGSPALYPSLRTNVPERIMTFSENKKFPFLDQPGVDELTKRESVEQYIVDYIDQNKNAPNTRLQTNTFVERVLKKGNEFEVIWRKDLRNGNEEWQVEYFDAVIVATGHYNVPRIPNVPGIDKVVAALPHTIIHSKGFVPDESSRNKKVIVVGSRSSAVDTVREIKNFTNDILWSIRDVNSSDPAKVTKTPRKPPIKEYILEDGKLTVVFEDNTKTENPDYIIYGTGYHFSYPFLNEYKPDLTANGVIIKDLYQHTFSIGDPLLSFVGAPVDGMSFRVFEYQAILIARYLAGKIKLPSKDEQILWHNERLEKYGFTRSFHSTVNDPALGYIEKLVQLGGGYDIINGAGKSFPRFSDEDIEIYQSNKAYLNNKWSTL